VKLAKFKEILKAENPLTGKTTSLLDIGGIFSMILGVVLFMFVVATGQNVARAVSGKLGGKIDTQIEPITSRPATLASEVIY
jgi:hypothetical protein